MKSTLLFLFGMLMLVAVLPAQEPAYPVINPALLYWQAAAQLAALNEPKAQELGKMASGELPADQEKIQNAFSGNAERLMRRAALSMAPCDWGLPMEDGPGMNMPNLPKMREMGILAVASGEAEFAEGKLEEGLDWLLLAHRIARHAGAGENFLSFIVQTLIDDLATRAGGRHCLGWSETTRHGYLSKLKALPPLHSLPASYHRDEAAMADYYEHLSRIEGPARQETLQRALWGMVGEGGQSSARAKEKDPVQWEPQTWHRQLALYRDLQRKTEAALALPWKTGHSELEGLAHPSGQEESLFYEGSRAVIAANYERNAATLTLRTMLDAVLQFGAQIDEGAAAKCHDAFEEAPLRLEKEADGTLRLVAAYQPPKGKEVELKLGK